MSFDRDDIYRNLTATETATITQQIERLYRDADELYKLLEVQKWHELNLPDKAVSQLAKATIWFKKINTFAERGGADTYSKIFLASRWTRPQLHRLLSRQYELEESINDLGYNGRDDLKAIYTRLSYLDDDERKLIMRHYYRPRGEHVTDTDIAEQLGIPVTKYKKQRLSIEAKLILPREYPKDYQANN